MVWWKSKEIPRQKSCTPALPGRSIIPSPIITSVLILYTPKGNARCLAIFIDAACWPNTFVGSLGVMAPMICRVYDPVIAAGLRQCI